ncbi:MAG: TrkH family potassium uptake protein [Gammaproteobacteria bacterium]
MSLSDVSRALAQPIRYRVVGHYLARIGLVIIVLRLLPIAISGMVGDWPFMWAQLAALCALLLLCWPLSKLKVPDGIRDNEVMVISAMSFLTAAILESLPLLSQDLNGIDALFEAVSGVTTTGLSMMSYLEHYSSGVLFTRAWMQWYGGLGVVAFSIALLFLEKGLAARRLAMGEIGDSRDILGNARSHSIKILVIYCSLTAFMAGILWLAGASPLSAATHALSGISTGGFSIYDASLSAVQPWLLQLLIMCCGLFGAISLPFYYRVVRNGLKEFTFNPETLALPVLLLAVTALLILCADESIGNGWTQLKTAIIMALSAQTTTGFANTDVATLNDASKFSLMLSMIIGGSIGSTAGGIKIFRLLVMLRLLQFVITRTALPPHAVLERRLSGDKLETDEIEKVLLLILIFAGTVLCSWLPFLLMGYAPLDALFEIVSACSTTGLSAGITRTALEPGLKIVLMLDMLLGRVEFIAFLVFLYPRTWIKWGNKT